MSSQTSTVVNLSAARQAKPRQQFQHGVSATHLISAKQAKANRLNDLPLQNRLSAGAFPPQKSHSWLTASFVVLAHAGIIYALITQNMPEKILIIAAKPLMVSLIAPPAPAPEIVPVIEPPKPVVKPTPIIKPKPIIKKNIEKIKPIEIPIEKLAEKPAERLVQAAVAQPVIEEESIAQVAPVQVADAVKVPPKSEPVVEEKIEPPRFGVSYLNNPPPDYPAMSRRIGEEGRVLMKVLVSSEGTAQEVQIETTSGSNRLDQAAVNAVKQWRFIPAKKNNQPLSAYVLVPMKFSLNS